MWEGVGEAGRGVLGGRVLQEGIVVECVCDEEGGVKDGCGVVGVSWVLWECGPYGRLGGFVRNW